MVFGEFLGGLVEKMKVDGFWRDFCFRDGGIFVVFVVLRYFEWKFE